MDKYLTLYVGTPDDSVEDFLFLDLVVGPYELSVDKSNSSLDGMTGDDFLDTLGDLLNTGIMFSIQLNLTLKLDGDAIITECQEQNFDETSIRNVRKLLKETFEGKGVKNVL